MRFLALFWGGWKILTRVLSSPSSSASLLLPRPSPLLGCSALLPHHLRLGALLPSVSLPLVPRTAARGRLLGPGPRPAGGASQRVAVGYPSGDHLATLLLTPISHMRVPRRFLTLARRNVRVPCV